MPVPCASIWYFSVISTSEHVTRVMRLLKNVVTIGLTILKIFVSVCLTVASCIFRNRIDRSFA